MAMINLDMFGLSEELSLFGGDDFLKPAATFSADAVTSVTDQPRCQGSGHEGKSELQKLLEGTADYVVSPVSSPPPPAVEATPCVSVPEPDLTQLYDADFSWSDTMVDLLDLNQDMATTNKMSGTLGEMATANGLCSPGGMPPGSLLELPTGLLDTPSGLLDTSAGFSDMSSMDPYVMLDELACLSPDPVEFTPLRPAGAVLKDSVVIPSPPPHESNILDASPALGSAYPSLFDDVLSLVMPDVEMADVPCDAVLSPVSVADVESLLASEPSSPMSTAHIDVAEPTSHARVDAPEPKRRSRARDAARPYECTADTRVLDRKLRKKQQNKVAALRYREKKRAENDAICEEASSLEKRNMELHDTVACLEREIQYLKDLMVEVALVKSEAA